jgi:DNA gyrase subunit A
LIEIDTTELVTAVVSTTSYDKDFMILATKKGEVKKTPLKEFESVRRAGLIAMGLEDGDELVFAQLAKEDDDVMLVSTLGKAMRFSATELRSASRMSGGVRGMRLVEADDEIVGLEIVQPDATLLTLSETGLGKRTEFEDYPKHSRGGQGVITHNVTPRTGRVVAARAVYANHELIVVSESGIVMRTRVESISKVGRSTQGVHVMNVGQGDRVASVATIDLSKTPAAAELAAADAAATEEAPPAGRRRARAKPEDAGTAETPDSSGNGRKPRGGGSGGRRNGKK